MGQILQYYAVFCLALSPLSVLAFIVLYRKTDLVDRLDRLIDKVLGVKAVGAAKEPDGAAGKKPEKDGQDAVLQDDPALSGIASFRMRVGDIYHCRQNSQSRGTELYTLVWSTSNEFIGKMDGGATFKALKAGTVKVFYARKDDTFDTGSQAYEITVLPDNPAWPLQTVVDQVSSRAERMKVMLANEDRKITANETGRRVLRYEGGKGADRGLVYQFDKSDHLERAVVMLRHEGREARERTLFELSQRFEQVELQGALSTTIWVHRLVDDTQDEVDVYCVYKDDMLAIGQTWREYGDIDEFLMNIHMAEKMFSDCIPGNVAEGYSTPEKEKDSAVEKPRIPAPATANELQDEPDAIEENPGNVLEETAGETREGTPPDPDDLPDTGDPAGEEPVDEGPVGELDYTSDYDSIEDFSEEQEG